MINKLLSTIKNASNQIAVVDNGKAYTYKDLYDFASRFSNYSGKKVVLALPKSFEYVGLVLSSFLYKFTFIPLDPLAPYERNLKIIKDVNPDVILSNTPLAFENFKYQLLAEVMPSPYKEFLLPEDYVSYIIYTSGSTGDPKGVEVLNSGLDNVITQQVSQLGLNKEQMFFYVSVLFDASISDILCSFYSHSTLHIKEDIKIQFKKFITYCNDYKISYIDIPPSILKYLDPQEMESLKVILVGGEVPLLEELKKWAKHIKVFNVYGPTEASICTSIYQIQNDSSKAYIGKPLNNIGYSVENGELLISGVGLAKGYTNAQLTQEKFFIKEGIRYYRTGDLVEQENDNYLFLGRNDDQIKHKGKLINLQEIAHQACSHPLIADAFGFYDQKFIYLIAQTQLTEKEIQEYLKQKLPKYMLPHKIVIKDKIFRNSSDKINKQKNLQYFDFFLHRQAIKTISSLAKTSAISPNSTKILITGATGYLGVHIASQMSKNHKLILLVRGQDLIQATERVNKQAEKYELVLNWSNIQIVLGDCSQANFGITNDCLKDIKEIIHCAAEVNNVKNFEQLYNSNIGATLEAIKISQHYGCRLQYISTLSVYVSNNNKLHRTISEAKLYPQGHEFVHGYGASKYFAEVMVQEAIEKKLINGCIYRLGLITEDTSKSYINLNSFLYLTIKEIQNMKIVPQLPEEKYIDLTPINWAVEDLINLFETTHKCVYNISYNIKLSYRDICTFFNKQEYTQDYNSFQHKLINVFLGDLAKGKRKNFNIFETTYVEKYESQIRSKNLNYKQSLLKKMELL